MTEDAEPPTTASERRRGSGARLVYDLLRDEILDLRLAPGSPIDEVMLAERFQMSRTPIREALVRLSGEGLVSTLPNRSTLVSPIDFLNLGAYFDALVLMYRVTTRLAAQRRSAQDLAVLRGHHLRYADAVAAGDALAMIALNAAFHGAIAQAGANPYFTALASRLLDEGRRILRLWPEGVFYFEFCITVLDKVLAEQHLEGIHLSPEALELRAWWSFRENVANDPNQAVAFLDLFLRGDPVWDMPTAARFRAAMRAQILVPPATGDPVRS